jgi:competence protein ComEC
VRLLHWLDAGLQAQRGALMPWSPVALGLGVGFYFAAPIEPDLPFYGVLVGFVLVLAGLARRYREKFGPFATVMILVALGVLLAGARAHLVAGPVLYYRYYGPIEGRIVAIDRSASDRVRITLDRVNLARMAPARTPRHVRVSLHGEDVPFAPYPGQTIILTGHLSPPNGPTEPGGFDFQRHAWFQQIGAVGYSRTPVLILTPPDPVEQRLGRFRHQVSGVIQDRIEGQAGAFAAAVLTGDRSGIEAAPLADLRRSNIAHLLAISGLHMGLLTGFIFFGLRLSLALIAPIALRFPIKKIAAVVALLAGAAYLALSGGNVATERAFVQVGVMFGAVLLDRRAMTLRSVAIAALIVLVHRPESLLGPGFQMSFAATTALVAIFAALRKVVALRNLPSWARFVFALVMSSVVAGAATAPFAAAHFNYVSTYGLIANLLCVPVMGSLVMPAAVLAVILSPFGLEWLAFGAMELGLNWILAVAHWVAHLPGARRAIMMPPGTVLPLITIGALFIILWQGRWRSAGVLPICAAAGLWFIAERPQVLIAASGGLIGVQTEVGRSLSRDRGDGFVAGIWLENDGDLIDQAGAAIRDGWIVSGTGRAFVRSGLDIWHARGGRASAGVEAACRTHSIVVTTEQIEEFAPGLQGNVGHAISTLIPDPDDYQATVQAAVPASTAFSAGDRGCLLISAELLAQTGSIALIMSDQGPRFLTARAQQGDRLWSPYESFE